MKNYDMICVGAGPTGLACAMEAKRVGMGPLVIDKGCLCNSIYNYPVNMVFFTTPELLEIGDLPMVCSGEKPTRTEALKYYRKATDHYGLPNEMGVPGEHLPHVSHYYTEPHAYWERDVVVIGGKNSAAEAAL